MPSNAIHQSYNWNVINGTGSAIIDSSGLLSAQTNGTVTVIAKTNDCSRVIGEAIITISNQTTVGINDIGFKHIKIYPNPANKLLNISTQEQINSIQIIDVTGKVIKVFASDNMQLDISELNTGIYYLEIKNKTKKSITKFIKY